MGTTIPDVTFDDVNSRFEGDLSDQFDTDYVETQIADAVDFVASRWRAQILMSLASGTLTDNLYKRVIANIALRVIRNPDGYASEGEGGYNYAQRANVASGALGVTQDEIDTLCGVVITKTVGTIGIGLDYGWS